MNATKMCRDKAHVGDKVLPLSEFGKRHTEPDGLAPVCKQCMRSKAKEYRIKGSRPPISTTKAQRFLENNGVPCVAGGAKVGHPYVDLLLWGCVLTEAKSAHKKNGSDKPTYHWPFTKKQATRHECDVVILIGHDEPEDHIFVLPYPVAQSLLNDKAGGRNCGGAISCAIGSEHHRAKTWKTLAMYEKNLDVIEQIRLEYAAGKRKIAKVCR